MNAVLSKTMVLGLTLMLTVAPGYAGDEAVDAVQPVFIPPLDFQGLDTARKSPLPGVPQTTPETVRTVAVEVGETITPQATAAIVNALEDASVFCARVPNKEYAVDCLSYRLSLVQETLPATGDYAEVKTALATAADKLNKLARQNADQRLPRGVLRTPDGNRTSRALTPVSTDDLAAVNAQAIAILEEAETVLLRSAQASEARRIPYQQIAAAVDSNKVLLRSL